MRVLIAHQLLRSVRTVATGVAGAAAIAGVATMAPAPVAPAPVDVSAYVDIVDEEHVAETEPDRMEVEPIVDARLDPSLVRPIVVTTVAWEGCLSAGVAISAETVITIDHAERAVCDAARADAAPLAPAMVAGRLHGDLVDRADPDLTVLEPGAAVVGSVRIVDDGGEVAGTLEPGDDGWIVVPDLAVRHGAAVVQDGHLVGFVDHRGLAAPR